MLDPEDCIMDFKAEEKKPQSTVFEIEDIESDTTISASEASSPTPALLCKLRKARVRIKKLPAHVLEKYNLNMKKSSLSSSTKPSRVSKRLGGKSVPGHYLSLHVNKPLNEVVNKKYRRKEDLKNSKSVFQDKRYLNLKQNSLRSSKFLRNKPQNKNTSRLVDSDTKLESRVKRNNISKSNDDNRKTNNVATIVDNPRLLRSRLYEKIVNTRKINPDLQPNQIVASKTLPNQSVASMTLPNQSVASMTLPNCPDVIITRYDLPPNNNHSLNPNNSPSVPLSKPSYTFASSTPSVVPSFLTSSNMRNTRSSCNITIQPNVSPVSSNQRTNAFPVIISSMNRLNETPYQPPIINAAINVTRENLLQQQTKKFKNLTTTVQTITIPPIIPSNKNGHVIVDSSKKLAIKQPSLRSDPLNMTGKKTNKKSAKNKENLVDNSETESCNGSETDIELTNGEKRPEPEVIKRIFYHTKSAQTKFTCPSNICGLIDSDEFNLNCFYCYDIFPLHKWLEFKQHIKQIHHVEEKAIQSDSEETSDDESQDCPSVTKSLEVKATQTIDLNSKDLSGKNNNTIIIKETTPATAVEVSKKLPLEPRLSSERLEESGLKVNNESKIKNLNLSQNSSQSKHSFDEVISLDSLDSDDEDFVDINDEIDNVDDIDLAENLKKNGEKVKESVNCNINMNNCNNSENDDITKLLPPSLSHITIKKVVTPQSSFTTNTTKPLAIEGMSMKESFIKIPSNINIQKIIKTIPKPTSEQLNATGANKPRYFVVKKILKPATTDKKPIINISKGTILTKMSESPDDSGTINVDKDMPSNDENEDDIPKPTNGSGILFGVTNRMVVVEFLLKLKGFPILWRPQTKNTSIQDYDQSIKKMCEHLNHRFELNIQEFEMRLSIQRVKDWYCRMLNNIHEHNRRCNNSEPYKHKFPLYFKILNQFLTSNVRLSKNYTRSILKSNTNTNKYKKYKLYNTGSPPAKETLTAAIKASITPPSVSKPLPVAANATQQTLTPAFDASTTPPSVSTTLPLPDTATQENIDNLIEFDADTMYEFESSDEEILTEFDETRMSNEELDKVESEPKPKQQRRSHIGHYECDICQKVCGRICDLKRHKLHHYPPQYECGVCGQKYYFKCWAERCNHLKKKQLKLGPEKIVADCPPSPSAEPKIKKTYTTQKNMGRIWPKKIFRFKMICEICGASYRSIGSLNSHKRDKHLNQRLKCIVCNFTALTNYRIVQHQKKRHIVEPGTVEEVAKKSRARMDTKTPFSVEARQEFDWRREMRAKLKPGEIFYGCCKCRIIFNSRKEKVLHNKMEHPIKETTVVCLLCLPTKLLLSNSNGARRHYTEIHKVPWDEIDALVKRTKPIFNILSKEEIELLNASENYKELLEELLKDREIEPKLQKVEIQEQEEVEALKAIQNLPNIQEKHKVQKVGDNEEEEEANYKVDVEYNPQQEEQDQNVFVDGIIDHDYNNDEEYRNVEHNYSEEQLEISETNHTHYQENEQTYVHQNPNEAAGHLAYHIECNEEDIPPEQQQQDDQEYLQSIVDGFVENQLADGDLVEECIVVEEECIDDIVVEDGEYY